MFNELHPIRLSSEILKPKSSNRFTSKFNNHICCALQENLPGLPSRRILWKHDIKPSLGMTSLLFAILLTLVSLLGLLLNVYIMFMVVITKEVKTANNLLLLHLGAVDTLLCLTFLVFSAPEMLKEWTWLAFGVSCNMHGFLFTLLHPVALWTVCGLNCDRYYAITSPLHYGSVVNSKKVTIGLAFAWILSLILCVPPLFQVAPYTFNPGLGGCAPDFGNNDGTVWYPLAYTSLTLLLPAILILGCNLRVLMIARYHRHRIASAIFEVTISAQVTITHQRNPLLLSAGNIFRGRSAISTVLQLIVSFSILYFPYYGLILWETFSSLLIGEVKANSTRLHPLIITFASTVLNCSPSVNGLLYGLKSKILRKSFQNYWRKQMSKSEINQEIQARTPSTCGSRRPSLTPIGYLSKASLSQLQRSSEGYPEKHGHSSARQILGALTWRPQSTPAIDFESMDTLRRPKSFREVAIQKHYSCNVLHTLKEHDFPLVKRIENSSSGCRKTKRTESALDSDERIRESTAKDNHCRQNVILHKMLGIKRNVLVEADILEESKRVVLESTQKKSPRILITRAFSEESDPSGPETDSRNISKMNRNYSSSTTALTDKRYKKLRYQDEEILEKSNKPESQCNKPWQIHSFSSASENDEHSSIHHSHDKYYDSREESVFVGDEFLDLSQIQICGEMVNQDTENVGRQRYYTCGSRFPEGKEFRPGVSCVLSWPIRTKSSFSGGFSKIIFARSATDLNSSEFQL